MLLESDVKAKEPERQALAKAVAAFKKNGGTIQANPVQMREWKPDYWLGMDERKKLGMVATPKPAKHAPEPTQPKAQPAKAATQPKQVTTKPAKVATQPTAKEQPSTQRQLKEAKARMQQLGKEIDAIFERLKAKQTKGRKA